MGATVDLLGADAVRTIPVQALYQDDGILYLSKQRDELLLRVHLPALNGWRASYRKLRRRGAFDFPVLGVGAWARFKDDGTVEAARVVLGGVGSAPEVVEKAGEILAGKRLTQEVIAEVAEACWKAGRPLDNTDFTLSWRKEMIRPYVARALADLEAAR
jgi:CO/xanthine dehydrogenase FAD-binding subunit